MDLTVILCTYNRCRSLATALESVALSEMPASVTWEVLVVDNNSKDDTRKVVEEYEERYPSRFRYLFEGKQGKSNALNAGISQARGNILAFMDDDVSVNRNWLQNLTTIFQETNWSGAGGPVLPEQGFAPPAWLSTEGKYALAPLALFNLGPQAGELFEAPIGTNMAFRKEVFEKVGAFRTDLGPQPGTEARSEDMEFGYRVLTTGMRLWYEPSAIVHHSLPAHRLRKEYFLAWWHDKAQADLRFASTVESKESKFQVGGVPLSAFRRLMRWTLQWITTISPAPRFSAKLKVWMVLGEISEYQRFSRQAGRQGEIYNS
jgi:glucosyl-dolichyl phosphate glucuronosyltransferase